MWDYKIRGFGFGCPSHHYFWYIFRSNHVNGQHFLYIFRSNHPQLSIIHSIYHESESESFHPHVFRIRMWDFYRISADSDVRCITNLKGKIIYAPSSTVRDPCWQLTNICCYSCRPLILKLASMALWVCYGTSHQNSLYSFYVVNFLIEYWRYIINLTLCKFLYHYSVCKYYLTNKPYTIGGGVWGLNPLENFWAPLLNLLYITLGACLGSLVLLADM